MALFGDIPFFGALILAAFGVLFCALGWQSFQEVRTFRIRGTRIDATVHSVAQSSSGEGKRTYRPTFTFTDADGNTVLKPTQVGSSSYDFEIGSTHAVFYLPGADTVLMADKRDGDIVSYALVLGGVLCLVVGLSGMVY